MIPYFFAANHTNYARYGLYYLMCMEKLPLDILEHFMKGGHVMRHQDGIWNGIWVDMLIETTFMRYGKGPGGLIGVTLNPETVKKWSLSLHTCNNILKDLDTMRNQEDVLKTHHKEELKSRIAADEVDRIKLRNMLKTCLHPLDSTNISSIDLINIYSGQISSDKVNVPCSMQIGRNQMISFEESWPRGFHETISKKVVTMNESKKHIKVGEVEVYNTEVIFARVVCLLSAGQINLDEIFCYELSPIPTSLFEVNGEPRGSKAKAVLKNALKVEIPTRNDLQVDVIILDGCAILWNVHWPVKGTVRDYIQGFKKYVSDRLKQCSVFLIFDKYLEHSIKGSTRLERAGKFLRSHNLTLEMPLPARETILHSTKNKQQLIKLISEQLLKEFTVECCKHRLLVTSDVIPEETHLGVCIKRLDLSTTHEEADVIIPQQLVHAVNEGAECIKVVCDDSDVFVLLLHFYYNLKLETTVLLESTTSSRNVVSIGKSVQANIRIIPSLLAAHALTGCDSVPRMFGKGKRTTCTVLKTYPLHILGEIDADLDKMMVECKNYVAACYGIHNKTNMSDVCSVEEKDRNGKINI